MRETYGGTARPTTGGALPANLKGESSDDAPTIARTAGHIGHNVAQSHEWVDRIEMAVFGPEPACAGGIPPIGPGLFSALESTAAASASLAHRLARIAEKIGG